MNVELGNTGPIEYVVRPFVEDGQVVYREVGVPLDGPSVTRVTIPANYTYEPAESAADLAVEVLRDVSTGDPAITHRPDQEALVALANLWNRHSNQKPAWVWSDNEDFAVLLGHYFNAPVGRPDASTVEVN